MTQNEILRGIIAHCSSATVRAARLLANPNKVEGKNRDEVMWRLAKAALESSDAAAFPDDLRTALVELVERGEAGLSRNRTVTVRFRCTEDERNKIQSLADRYSDGNMSRWLVKRGTAE